MREQTFHLQFIPKIQFCKKKTAMKQRYGTMCYPYQIDVSFFFVSWKWTWWFPISSYYNSSHRFCSMSPSHICMIIFINKIFLLQQFELQASTMALAKIKTEWATLLFVYNIINHVMICVYNPLVSQSAHTHTHAHIQNTRQRQTKQMLMQKCTYLHISKAYWLARMLTRSYACSFASAFHTTKHKRFDSQQ